MSHAERGATQDNGVSAAVLTELAGEVVELLSVTPLAGGACQDNLRVDLTRSGRKETWVLRHDAPSSLAGSIDRAAEFEVIAAARAAHVLTPEARFLGRGLLGRPGWGYLSAFMPGTAIGRQVLERPELAAARSGLATALAIELAKVHSVATDVPLPIAGLGNSDPAEAALTRLESLLRASRTPLLALELVIAWLVRNAPPAGPRVLVHGDFRTGNFLVSPAGLSAILDWEFAHFGAAEEDLGWIAVRDWRFGHLDRPIGGFAARDDFYAAYESASGRELDRRAIHWWEVYGNARWAAGCLDQADRYRAAALPGPSGAGKGDLEFLAIGRRASEMAFEAMRLIEAAP